MEMPAGFSLGLKFGVTKSWRPLGRFQGLRLKSGKLPSQFGRSPYNSATIWQPFSRHGTGATVNAVSHGVCVGSDSDRDERN